MHRTALLPIVVGMETTRTLRFHPDACLGDHVGIGCEFGAVRRREAALRIEHFSNAGVDHPNPGDNFVQLRWVARR
jgi:lipid A 3-O-deacylase